MAGLWQSGRPQHDTVDGRITPVNIYLPPRECACLRGAAWRQELLWGFICAVTRQPVIYEHLELLFKHTPYLTTKHSPGGQPERSRSVPGRTRPDETSHRLTACPTRAPWAECQARRLGTLHHSARVCLQGVLCGISLDSREQQCDITVTEIICSEPLFRPANRAGG